MCNPSKRSEKATFLIRIGNGFIVDSYCVRLDKLEPPMFGTNTPEDWIIELCSDLVRKHHPDESCDYKTFVVELEIKALMRARKYDSSSANLRFKNSRENKWRKSNKDEKVNPSMREKQ